MSKLISLHWWSENVSLKRRLALLGFGVLLVILILLFNSFILGNRANAEGDANTVILTVAGQQRTIPTDVATVGKLLKKLDITISKGDVVEPTLDTKIDQDRFRINIYRGVPVKITDGEHTIYSVSAAASPRRIASLAGVKVYPEDWISRQPVTNFVRDQAIAEKIVIDRATPVKFRLYGHAATIRTHVKTVGDLLSQKKITLKKGDTLTPSASTKLTPGMELAINHHGTKYKTVTETVAPPVKYIPDSSLSIGTSVIRQNGSSGKSEITYKITTKNGHEVSRKAVQKVVIEEPVKQIVARGTANVPVSTTHQKWMSEAGISPRDQGYADYIIRHESNWNPAAVNWGGCNGSNCYGLGQSKGIAAIKSACPDWRGDPVCQLRFFKNYVHQHGYGSWYNAYLFKRAHGWW